MAVLLGMAAVLAAGAFAALLQGPTRTAAARPVAFGWLRPMAPPDSWRISRLPHSPAEIAYPRDWRLIRSDSGARTAALRGPSGTYLGYLNATPKSGGETLKNWRHFRPAHIAKEGERRIRVLASGRQIRFRAAIGSCLTEGYTTSTDHRYREVACLVAGQKASTVVVAAAPPSRWGQMKPVIEQAISSFKT
jgi:hypothetical protein